MSRLLHALDSALRDLEQRSLRRRLRIAKRAGRHVHVRDDDGTVSSPLVDLSSNDYLALSDHAHLKRTAIDAINEHGVGGRASRLAGGHAPFHEALEHRFARFKHAEAAVLFPTGFMANLAALGALAGPGDLICMDKLNHASLIDAARASGATVRTFAHLNYDQLERILHRAYCSKPGGPGIGAHTAAGAGKTFIVTDAVFSMDGTVAGLPRLVDVAVRFDAMLIVDEAHATGVLGPTGAGLAEHQGVADRVDVVISTASKALGGLGGIVSARQVVIDTIVNCARAFIYTTAVPPAQVAAIDAALDVVRDEPARRRRLQQLAALVREQLTNQGWAVPPVSTTGELITTPMIPLIVGDADAALALSAHLQDHGYLATAIRPPTVPPGTSRVRLSVRTDLEDDEVTRLVNVLADARTPMPSR